MTPQTLYYGDCLDWMQGWPDESVDLIYLDPPFNSNANYNILFGEGNGIPAQVRAFRDTWKWDAAAVERTNRITNAISHPSHRAITGLQHVLRGSGMLAYVSYMAERLPAMRRLMKPTASIYLHCDPTASHYLKILMDGIFGPQNFRNEIVWAYRTGGVSTRYWPRKHDILLFYVKTNAYQHHPPQERVIYDRPFFNQQFDEQGRPFADVYIRDVWDGETVRPVINVSSERIGYPTQKPVALLERIINASSNEGDLVLDPFCGGGTTIAAAANLKRQWIGVDISPHAIDITQNERLTPLGIEANVEGIPQDLAGARRLARNNSQDFEAWAVTRIPGLAPNEIKVGDGGIDGRGRMQVKPDNHESPLVLAQVKGGQATIDQVRAFLTAMDRDNAAMGIFITLDRLGDRSSAWAETASKGNLTVGAGTYPRAQLWSIAEYFDDRMPGIPTMLDPNTGQPVQGRLV